MLNSALQEITKNCSGRLKKRPEFLSVAKNGKKWVSQTIIVQALSTDREITRFGFTATKKIGNAVVRNRAKRRMRALADEIKKNQNLKSYDLVFIARNNTAICEWNELLKDAKWCLKRLEVLSTKNDE